jgi:heme exporter protein A
VIELTDLRRSYGERVVLDGFSLSVGTGETVLLLGPNGAGKSTLLRILAGLLRPHGGSATVLGAALPSESWKLKGRVGFLGHEALLYRDLSPAENLAFHARLHGVAPGRAAEVLDQVGLGRRADDPVRTLSRGMVQRAAIARAVLHAPDLLLLDEPYANLDPGAVEQIRPLLTGPTRVLVSHDVEAGRAEADRVVGLRAGRATSDIEGLYAR